MVQNDAVISAEWDELMGKFGYTEASKQPKAGAILWL